MKSNKIYQASTLQALALGYTKPVVMVKELLEHGDTGLGTFEHVDGEMIVLDGVCYQAKDDGSIVQAEDSAGVPFAVAGTLKDGKIIKMENMKDIEAIKKERAASNDKALFFDIPLLFETGSEDDYDAVWVVTADYDLRKNRVMARDGIDPSIIDLIMDSQDGEEKKVQLADHVIYNNGTLDELRESVDAVLRSYGLI